MATFTEQLADVKRRAQLQGRPISQREVAGVAQGQAQTAADRTIKAEQLALQKESIANSKEQFQKQLSAQGSQFATQLAAQKEQFEKSYKLDTEKLTAQITDSQRMYDQAVSSFEEQVRQFNSASETQKTQFGEQMQLQIQNSQAEMERFKSQFELAKSQYVSELVAADQPIPASMAPEGWNASKYISNYADLQQSGWASQNPLAHWYLYGKGEGRSYL
jgi:hypothetical protein